MQLSDALKGFVFSKVADGRSPHTVNGYKYFLGMMRDYLHDPHVTDIRLSDLRAFMAWLQTDYKPKRKSGDTSPLSHHSLDSYWIAIRAFFTWAEQDLELSDRPPLNRALLGEWDYCA